MLIFVPMRFSILVILLSITTFSYAQTKKKKTSSYSKPDIATYFHSHQLAIDSALSPFLYYQVYEWIGTRYKYSGETKKGIDCSGFALAGLDLISSSNDLSLYTVTMQPTTLPFTCCVAALNFVMN